MNKSAMMRRDTNSIGGRANRQRRYAWYNGPPWTKREVRRFFKARRPAFIVSRPWFHLCLGLSRDGTA
jgi:hypothetical protein